MVAVSCAVYTTLCFTLLWPEGILCAGKTQPLSQPIPASLNHPPQTEIPHSIPAYSFSHSKAKHRVVYTTLDTATIHTPKCQQSKITRALNGTCITATKSKYIIPVYSNTSPSHTHIPALHIYIEIPTSEKDPEQTPPELDVQIKHLTLQKTQTRTGCFT